MKKLLLSLILCLGIPYCYSQSFEFMPGLTRIFIDAQYLKPFDKQYRWTLFVRGRATTEYNENVNNLFLGSYLNYTTPSGFGGSFIGRISNTGSGFDVGPHFTKTTTNFTVFALPFVNVGNDRIIGWFSILRFTPKLNENWKQYTSLELFTNFDREGHVISVQRMRLGADRSGYQFGIALNLSQFGRDAETRDDNLGIFVRKQFD